jgi:histidinol-phosphate aminotransferase
MTVASDSLTGIRGAVRRAPAYPFTPIQARIKLDQNESGYDFPLELKKLALEKMLHADWNRYPDMHADGLREKIAARVGWDAHGVVVTPGSNVLIHALAQAAGMGQRVLSVSPAFSLYALSGKLLEAKLTELSLEPNFALPVAALESELKRGGPGVLFLAEPHAPTGALHDLEHIKRVVNAASEDWIVVLDEAYFEYSGRTHLEFLQQPNVCILRTFSKAWGLGGVRLGYLLANPALSEHVQKIVSPFNVSALVTAALEVALEHPEYVQTRVDETLFERTRVFEALRDHPTWRIHPSHANYHLIRTMDAKLAHAQLLERGILVRRQDSYAGLEGCIRVSIGTPDENTAFIEAALSLS